MLAPVIRAEHKRWDGKGYRDGLSGKHTPLASRVVFACDSLHAMISNHPYRKAIGVRAALEKLERNPGQQFNPSTVRALLDVAGDTRADT